MPEASERWNAWIFRAGSALPPLSAAIAGSDQSVILPSKMPPRVLADRFRVGAFGTLYMTAIAPGTVAIETALPPEQRASAGPCWAVLSGKSEPAQSAVLFVKLVMPAPEPLAV